MPALAYYLVSGATTAWRAREIVPALLERFERVLTIPTPGAARVISVYDLSRIPGNHVVESYLDDQLRPRPEPGAVIFAPCSFNSLNKLAAGIADHLALSIAAEMVGLGQPALIALSMNEGLWMHSQTKASVCALRRWGVCVLEPQRAAGGLSLAPLDALLAELDRLLCAGQSGPT
ncbi:MAG: flavoprotein [Anaerolineae bacterium]|nr:hypothetical protein [Thermoflexales bacterium]MDW8407716.1 flavoprotein [Anaerolineae bacterium]